MPDGTDGTSDGSPDDLENTMGHPVTARAGEASEDAEKLKELAIMAELNDEPILRWAADKIQGLTQPACGAAACGVEVRPRRWALGLFGVQVEVTWGAGARIGRVGRRDRLSRLGRSGGDGRRARPT